MATYEDCVREAGDWGPWQWRMEAAMLAPAAAASMATLSWLFTARSRPPDPAPAPAPAHYSVLTDLGAEAGGWVAALLPPAFMLGMLVGGPALGLLSDRAGRRAGLLASLALVTGAASLLPLLPHSAPWHATWRLVAGAGTQGALVTTFVYLVEWPGAGRGGAGWRLVAALGLHLGWGLGQVVLVLASCLLPDWRHLHWATAAPALLAAATTCWLPESARWVQVTTDQC